MTGTTSMPNPIPPPRRALFLVNGAWSGGPIVFLHRATARLKQFGWNSEVIFVSKPTEFATRGLSVPFHVTPTSYSWLTMEKRLAGMITAAAPDVVIAFALEAAPLAMRRAYATGEVTAPYLETIHSDIPAEYQRVRRNADITAAVAAVSSHSAANARAKMPQLADRVFRIFYPVPCASDPPSLRPASGPIRLLYVGMLRQHEKRVLDLAAITAELLARKIDFALTIVGDGADRAELQRKLAWLPGTKNRIRFEGWLASDKVLDLLPDHDVLLLVSEVEGQSIAMLEGMGCGVIPIVTDLPGLREVIRDGTSGFLQKVGDAVGFASRIEELVENPELMSRMRLAAWERIRSTHAVPTAVGQFAALLDQVCRLPLPDRAALARPGYPGTMARWRVPTFVQALKRWCFRQEVA